MNIYIDFDLLIKKSKETEVKTKNTNGTVVLPSKCKQDEDDGKVYVNGYIVKPSIS